MKTLQFIPNFLLLLLSSALTSCQVIEGIFKAGMGFGIFLVVLLGGGLIFLVMRIMKK
jgi:hypothetical protein